MNIIKPLQHVLLACQLLMLGSCTKDHDLFQKPDDYSKKDFFDFSLTQTVSAEIDYGFEDYVILFEIYDRNPFEEKENTLVKKEIEPLFRAATDKTGKYSGKITLPSYLTELWLVSDYFGAISPVRLEITGESIAYDQQQYIANSFSQTRALSPNGHTYPDDYLITGDWDNVGKPDYLLSDLATPPASILYDIRKIYSKSGDYAITKNHPEFFTGNMSSDIVITKPTKINLVFLASSAGWNNTVGYYTYPTGRKPQSDTEIRKIVAFPNASPLYYNGKPKGGLLCGSQVQLKYWDGSKYTDEFPAGVTIGWFLQGMGFNSGNLVKGMGTRYSAQNLNTDGKQRAVSLRDPQSNQIVAIGFEDNADFDYCDATFYLDVETKDAIDDSTLPPLPDTGGPTENENFTTYYGTLTFEDLWPAQGDYDMNDLMMDYNCKVYKNIVGNKVSKIVDEFTPKFRGGTYRNGFGYQLHNLTAADIRNVTIEGPATSAFMNGNNLEEGQAHPTIILFDDISNQIGRKFTVTIELNDVENSQVVPPYNPFIIAKTNEGRGREVHLVNYPPTSKADLSLLGTLSDLANPGEELYYISKDRMPFAINLVQIKDFPIPQEGIRIDISYPNFAAWAQSFGKEHKDWYKSR